MQETLQRQRSDLTPIPPRSFQHQHKRLPLRADISLLSLIVYIAHSGEDAFVRDEGENSLSCEMSEGEVVIGERELSKAAGNSPR